MTFQIPNLPDALSIDQSEPDAVDFAVLGESNTGVITGCSVTAQGSPALFVDIAAGTLVLNGAPKTVTSGSLAIIAGEAQPRFDLIAVDSTSAKVVIKGTASTNPRFPAFNPTTHCLLAAIYIPQSAASILTTYVTDKRRSVQATLTRAYADGTTEAVAFTDNTTTKTWKVMSDGEHRWMSNILKRTADSAMEWATSLVMKAADVAQAVLILRARSGSAAQIAAQHLLEIQTNGGTPIAYVTGGGQAFFDNFKSGLVDPEGAVMGNKGDIYVNRAFTDANDALFLKSTDGVNTGWVAMAKFDPSAQALGTGTVIMWVGNPGTPPAGWVVMNGQNLAVGGANAALYTMIGNQYGGTPAVNFNVPDWTNVSPMGVGSTVALGAKAGAINVVLTINQLPAHSHQVLDPGHTHPIPGFEYLWSDVSQPTWIRPYPSNLPPVNTIPSIPYINIAPFGFNRTAVTNIVLANTGSGATVPTLSPVVGTYFLVRL